MHKGYIRSTRYPGSVWATEMSERPLKAKHEILNSIQGFETA